MVYLPIYIYPQNQPNVGKYNIPVPWMVWDRGYNKPLQGSLYKRNTKFQLTVTNTQVSVKGQLGLPPTVRVPMVFIVFSDGIIEDSFTHKYLHKNRVYIGISHRGPHVGIGVHPCLSPEFASCLHPKAAEEVGLIQKKTTQVTLRGAWRRVAVGWDDSGEVISRLL